MNVKDDNGVGVIHFAAVEGKLNVLKYLIKELGLDVNMKDRKGYTEILTRLLSRGVNVNTLSENGTPLDMAANHDQLEALQILLEQNANPNLSSRRAFTTLAGSIVSGSLRCVEPLLESSKGLVNIYLVFLMSAFGSVLLFLIPTAVVELLLFNHTGADPDGGSYGATPLVVAATNGLTQTIKLLIQAGAKPDITNTYGLTSLEIATLNGFHNVGEILFPVTSRIPEYTDWSIGGVIAHVQSDQAKKHRELKAKEKFHEAKLSGADAFKKQDYFNAMVCYSQANEIDPHDAIILSNRSMCWARMKEGTEALEDANACISLRPDWPKAYYRAGVAYTLLRRYSDAQKAFLDGLKLSPNSQELKDAFMLNSTTPLLKIIII
ncbi:ankyrin repeat domain-containing protein 7-like [Papaver somniferum]|uniref:ankyrin repeat domain-containing protein 7-like n=1 Tax=Papaver somniferum TaxID=3469 RepID=UPI000E6FCD3F|nr:ankyrin repeat domain-containing protein 7-like [Papaver somniferum]